MLLKNNLHFNKFNLFLFSVFFNVYIASDLLDSDLNLFFLLVSNGTISLMKMILVASRVTLSLSFFIDFFLYLFFFIVPNVHYHYNSFNYFIDASSTYSYAEYSLLLILLFNTIFSFQSLSNFNITSKPKEISFLSVTNVKRTPFSIWLIILLSILLMFYLGTQTLLLRGSDFAKSSSESMVRVMVFSYFFRPLVFFYALIEYVKRKYTKKVYDVNFILLVIVAFLLNIPTSTARFYTLFLFIVFISTIILSHRSSKLIIPSILTFGINFSFFFSRLRFLTSINDFKFEDFSSFDTRSFIDSIHFDAFEVSLLALRYVDREGFTFGQNILGALFFFVPRSIWTTKPEPSGVLIINNKINLKALDNESFTNISFPLFSEMYIAFGIVGIVLLALILRYVVKYVDNVVSCSLDKRNELSISSAFNLILASTIVSLSFFILRGTLMVSYSYSLSIILSFFVALKLAGIKYKFRK